MSEKHYLVLVYQQGRETLIRKFSCKSAVATYKKAVKNDWRWGGSCMSVYEVNGNSEYFRLTDTGKWRKIRRK